ncbi:hypothetical protein R0K17_20415, partial [Planococcus sp. SIMBA_143]
VVFSNLLLNEGLKATAYTGGQAGFMTTAEHSKARILEMKSERLMEELKLMDVVVVTGFQGVTKDGDVTTLGRGGSDTSAAALGAGVRGRHRHHDGRQRRDLPGRADHG